MPRGRIVTSFEDIDPAEWQSLQLADNPFLDYAFLAGLEQTGSIGEHAGWHPHHLAIMEGERLLAFAPTYAKDNSHGEFVFDWAWADAYHRHGAIYYPKLLTGVPYTPVTGPRLLVRQGAEEPASLKRELAELALTQCRERGYSTWHCNFVEEDDFEVLAGLGLLRRRDWQFHWLNRGYPDFDAFLAKLRSRKRKNIRRERQRVSSAGVTFEWKSGDDLSSGELDFVYHCYLTTFRNYGNYPALQREFFSRLAQELKESFQVVLALRGGEAIAMAVFLAGGGRLYGRYWGCTEELPGLHFETAYYQGIEYCIRHGIEVFESGAQGEHKIPRGFLPTRTRSCHHVEHPSFREAIDRHLERESQLIDGYREELDRLDPYRRDEP
ncbi:MAG: N-acetyltransferase [Xanthomonadales bacterium]|nr:N-acetyltransferase [Xanthomonadales bacterium]